MHIQSQTCICTRRHSCAHTEVHRDKHACTHIQTHRDTQKHMDRGTIHTETHCTHRNKAYAHTETHEYICRGTCAHRHTCAQRHNSHRETLCIHRSTCMCAHRETLTCTSIFLDYSTTSSHIYPLGFRVSSTQSSKGERTETDPHLQLQVRVLLKTRVLVGAEDTQAIAAEL